MKSYYGEPIGTHQRSFERYHPRPPKASPSPRLGVRNPNPKLQLLLSQERLKLWTANLADIFTGSIRTKAHEKFGRKGSVSVSRDCPINFLEYPLLSQEWVKLQTSNLAGTFTWSIRTKSRYKFGRKRSVGVSRDCLNFLSPPIILGIGKATNFKFCTHIHRIDRNKSPLKISAKVGVGVLRAYSKIFRAPIHIGRIARSSLR